MQTTPSRSSTGLTSAFGNQFAYPCRTSSPDLDLEDVISRQIRDFYASHSPTSDPGSLSPMLDDLPVDIDAVIDAIGGLLMHPHTAHDLYGESEPADRGAGYLTMKRMLQHLHTVDPAPLTQHRPSDKRLRLNCGRFAMIFVSILRHCGIPARKRVGFDWDGWIHEIAEYWDDQRNQWVLLDPNPAARKPIRDFLARIGQPTNAITIRPGEAFTPGCLAWRLCRAGQADPNGYQISDHDGMSSVRIALLQDLDSVNKVELRTFDEWHEMITAPMQQLDDAALDWLDHAALIEDCNTSFDELQAFYANSAYGSKVRTRLTQLVA